MTTSFARARVTRPETATLGPSDGHGRQHGPNASVDDPGTPLRGTVSLTGTASDPGGAGVASAHLPALARKRWQLDDRGHGHELALLGLLRHDRRLGRALRPAPVATDQAGNTTISALVTNRRVDNTAPSASLDDPGANLRGDRHALLDRERRRLRDRLARLCVLARRRRQLDDDPGRLRHDGCGGRALRPARHRHRQRRQLRRSRPRSPTAGSTTRLQPPRWTIRAPT